VVKYLEMNMNQH